MCVWLCICVSAAAMCVCCNVGGGWVVELLPITLLSKQPPLFDCIRTNKANCVCFLSIRMSDEVRAVLDSRGKSAQTITRAVIYIFRLFATEFTNANLMASISLGI